MLQHNSTPKKKIVTFRLTEMDLQRYEAFCIDEQIRMSDLIRHALQTKVQECIDEMPGVQFISATEAETVWKRFKFALLPKDNCNLLRKGVALTISSQAKQPP